MTNQESNNQMNQQAQEAAEPRTIINGKMVPLSQATKAMEMAEAAATQTGIQAHHDNTTEAVQAGQVAQQSQAQQQEAQVNIRQANVQSAGEHLESHVNQAQSASQQQSQQMSGTRYQEGASELTTKISQASSNMTNQAAEEQKAAQLQQQSAQQPQSAQQQATSKARAAKTNKAD